MAELAFPILNMAILGSFVAWMLIDSKLEEYRD